MKNKHESLVLVTDNMVKGDFGFIDPNGCVRAATNEEIQEIVAWHYISKNKE